MSYRGRKKIVERREKRGETHEEEKKEKENTRRRRRRKRQLSNRETGEGAGERKNRGGRRSLKEYREREMRRATHLE